ncbi:MAG: hypothetical protein R3D85_09870 [Paracoccaceae bacterium]
MTFVEACRAWKAVNGALPCKITFFSKAKQESARLAGAVHAREPGRAEGRYRAHLRHRPL